MSKNNGKIDTKNLIKKLNKKFGMDVAHDISDGSPSDVTDWISTGSTLLDASICRGKSSGIPVGKVIEIAGLESTGKSFLAGVIAGEAQKKGYTVVYLDSESSLSSEYLPHLGIELDNFIYVQAYTVEKVYETIQELVSIGNIVFIWDSYANTSSEDERDEDSFNPTSSVAYNPRVNSKAMRRITIELANNNSTLLILNQLKVNITSNFWEAKMNPYKTTGGKALEYVYSLRLWLTKSSSKNNTVFDDRGFPIGNLVRVKIKKSRFGTENRECEFKIIWGDKNSVGVQDEDSWFEALKNAKRVRHSGAGWYEMDGYPDKIRGTNWVDLMKQDPDARKAALRLIEEEVILKNTKIVVDDEDSNSDEEE